jgi:hypothetical protein
MGVAVSGMHYTGMAAMQVSHGTMSPMAGSTAASFLVPLLLGISLVTFVLTLTISLSPTEEEINADAVLQRRIDTEFAPGMRVGGQGPAGPAPAAAQRPAAARPAAPAPAPAAFTRGGYNATGPAPDFGGGPDFHGGQAEPPEAPSQPLPSRRSSNGHSWGQPPRGGH